MIKTAVAVHNSVRFTPPPRNRNWTNPPSQNRNPKSEIGLASAAANPICDFDFRFSDAGFVQFQIFYFLIPAAGSLVRRLNSASIDGTQISSRISSFGCSLNTFFSLTQAVVYVFGSVSVIVSSNVSPTRRQRSSRRISSLYGLPN